MDLTTLAVLQVNWPLSEIWGTAVGFIAFVVAGVGFIGMGSRSLSLAIIPAYTAFAWYAANTDIMVLQTTFYVTMALIILGVSFKLWRLEGMGEGA